MSKPRLAIAALPLIDPNTRRILSRERWTYARELTRLLLQLDYDVEWWQPGPGWVAELLPGVPLAGALGGAPQLLTWPQTSEHFREKAAGADGAIYFDLVLAYPQVHPRAVALSHGVYWDDPLFESTLHDGPGRREWRRRLWIALTSPSQVVAVDTGLIQWATTTWPGLNYKFAYIPNFVPSEEADPEPAPAPTVASIARFEARAADHPVTVCFAAPMLPKEGVAETIRAMEPLLRKYERLRFHLIGRGTPGGTEHMARWADGTPGARYDPDASPRRALAAADVALFPAKSGQGTSMLCLLAMAQGTPVVVGHTGGLTDLVIHGHNGLVLRPTAEEIAGAVSTLLHDPERRRAMGAAAREVAETFSLVRWRARWRAVLNDAFGALRLKS